MAVLPYISWDSHIVLSYDFGNQKLEVSVAYAVFVGIGAAGIVLAEMLVFGESIDFVRIILIGTLLFGVIGLKLTSKSKSEQKITQDISAELGLDNLMRDKNTQIKEHTC